MKRSTQLLTVMRGGAATAYPPAQSFGAELLVNGDFSDGSGTFPNGWTKTNDNGTNATITETAANGSAGTGAATFARLLAAMEET